MSTQDSNEVFRPLTAQEQDELMALGEIPHQPVPDAPPACGVTLRFFEPQPDITAYEVAQTLAATPLNAARGSLAQSGLLFDDDVWNDLPDTLKRHWSET